MSTSLNGHLHPITQTIEAAIRVFRDLGFGVAQGNEIVTEYYNFDALNVPKDHPARDMQDTFFVKGVDEKNRRVLRTHTSAVQVQYLETHTPPVAIVVPGKVFRNEATDATHEAQFYQLEGFLVDKDVTVAHLKGTLDAFAAGMFGREAKTRFRPSFFPFVEPGFEIDVSCFLCNQKGCSVCKHTGWIEVLGAGMVHPKVLSAARVDPRRFQGFAFGVGIDRIVMLRHAIPDIRMLYQGDLRLVEQF